MTSCLLYCFGTIAYDSQNRLALTRERLKLWMGQPTEHSNTSYGALTVILPGEQLSVETG